MRYSPSFRCFDWLRGKSSQFVHFFRIIFDFVNFMVISFVNFSQRNALDGLLVSWVDVVREALNFSIQVTSLLFVTIGGKDLCEGIPHFHFSIESSCHVAIWRESASFLCVSGNRRFCVVISIVWWKSLPFFLDS